MKERRAPSPNNKRRAESSGRSEKSKKASTKGDSPATTQDLVKDLLNTKEKSLIPRVQALPVEVSRVFIDHARSMRSRHEKINVKTAALQKFQTSEGEEPYIPNSVRSQKLLVTVPTSLRDDQQPSGYSPEAATVMEEIKAAQAEYIKKNAIACEKLLKLEIKKLKEELMDEVCDHIFDLAIGLATSEYIKPDVAMNLGMDANRLAYRAVIEFIKEFTLLSPANLRTITAGLLPERKQFCERFTTVVNKIWGLELTLPVDSASTNSMENANDDLNDDQEKFVQYIVDNITPGILESTVNLWKESDVVEDKRQANSELIQLYGKKRTDAANRALAAAMDVDDAATDTIVETATNAARRTAANTARTEIQKEFRRLNNKQRNFTSGGAVRTQRAPSPTSNGPSGRENQRKQQQQPSNQQRGRLSTKQTKNSSNNSQHSSLRSNNRSNNTNNTNQHKRRASFSEDEDEVFEYNKNHPPSNHSNQSSRRGGSQKNHQGGRNNGKRRGRGGKN